MRILTRHWLLLFILTSARCYSQNTYDHLLDSRLSAIRELDVYDNSVVVYDANQGYGTGFPKWHEEETYYQDDVVFDDQGRFFIALSDNLKGQQPESSPDSWRLIRQKVRPYLFLRDSARTKDLLALLNDKHPFIKTYAFAALAKAHQSGLFEVIVSNLSDTTQINQMTVDFISPVYPVELMITYLKSDLSPDQKRKLEALIQARYKHLAGVLDALREK
ncbi:MAG TPA: hypothetical protein PK325_07260 [Cyclobacteriaceae bacterium]|nr:hypothetical protein [Cyclobacteriaceae bacterium]HMV09388.1 hypothetical protein [Cyclobacteriaceae bacterium]HMX00963.1 hypothetical protein [Cyclobacteriaceae bacterium]HMX51103.1 hypothetical protein [Cyclobacteriaceae bacterium]HMY91765.1 hypothetical protein [Cyclobacteriaceae bacterium]